MKQSVNGAAVTKRSESLRLTAYLCPAKRLTIGWGHTGSDVKTGMSITIEKAQQLYLKDIGVAEREVLRLVKRPLTQGQFDALVDFVFNVGSRKVETSVLLELVNGGASNEAIAVQFRRWVYGGDGSHNGRDDDGDGITDEPGEKQRLPGLVTRREREIELWID